MLSIAEIYGRFEPKNLRCQANYDPVCGCDDRTYDNECTANANGVNVARQGQCRGQPTRPPTLKPTRKPTNRPTTRRPTNRRPTAECEEAGESAAEYIVFDEVCMPMRQQSQSRPQYSPACRDVAVNECEGQMTRKLEQYCPDYYDDMSYSEILDLQNMCKDQVDAI